MCSVYAHPAPSPCEPVATRAPHTHHAHSYRDRFDADRSAIAIEVLHLKSHPALLWKLCELQMTLHVLGICLPGSFAARPPSPRAPGRYGYALVQLMVDACCTSKGGWYCRAGMPRAGTGGGGKDPPYFGG